MKQHGAFWDVATVNNWCAQLREDIATSVSNMVCLSFMVFLIPLSHRSWFWGEISREEAEKLLLGIDNKSGTFMIRRSNYLKDFLSLSLRDEDDVKHYPIWRRSDDGSYYISTQLRFNTLQVCLYNCTHI